MIKWIAIVNRLIIAIGSPETVFLVFALTAGLFLVFANGPFQSPDEPAHFLRAYQISEGHLLGERLGDKSGGSLPRTIIDAAGPFRGISKEGKSKVNKEMVFSLLDSPLKRNERMFASFINTVMYSPLCYLPHALGMAGARLIGLSSPLEMMYGGRTAGLLCWIAFIYAAIRITPVLKWVVCLAALMPMTLYLAASLTADTMAIACITLLFAMVLRERLKEERCMTLWRRVGTASLCAAVSMMKMVYAPLAALVLIFPRSSFSSSRDRLMYNSSVLGFSLLVTILWGLEIQRVYVPLKSSTIISVQLSNILTNPLDYVKAIINTDFRGPAYSLIGVLGWLDTWLPPWVYVTYVPVLFVLALFDPAEHKGMNLPEKAFLLCLCCLTAFLIVTSQYLSWSPVGSTVVEGIQGRYFIPLLPLMLVLMNRTIPRRYNLVINGMATIYSAKVLHATCLTVYGRYYG